MKSIFFVLCQIMIFGVYRIPNDLLMPHLSHHSMVAINRLAFGLHLPFFKPSVVQWGVPKSHDLVFVTTKQGKNLIRRVIGLPRDVLIFNGKRLVVPDNTIFVGLSDENAKKYPKEFGFIPIKNILGKCVFVLD